MSTFNESEHPRDNTTGEFATKNQSGPEVSITAPEATVKFTGSQLLDLADDTSGPIILAVNGAPAFHPFNGYLDRDGDIVLEGSEDEETNAITSGQLKSLVDQTSDGFKVFYYTDEPQFTELEYARVDGSNQLILGSNQIISLDGDVPAPVRPLDIVAYRVNGALMTPEAAFANLYLVDEDDDLDSGNAKDDLERAIDQLAGSLGIHRGDREALAANDVPVHLYAEHLEAEDYRQLGLPVPTTSTDWDELEADDHLFFENDGGPRSGWIEIHRTSEETDADNESDSEVWAEAGQEFELAKVLPGSASDDGASLERHQNAIDSWLRSTYNDGRFIEGSTGYEGRIIFSVDSSDTFDGKFPATIDGVRELVSAKTEIVQLKADLASGVFYERLRAVIAGAEAE